MAEWSAPELSSLTIVGLLGVNTADAQLGTYGPICGSLKSINWCRQLDIGLPSGMAVDSSGNTYVAYPSTVTALDPGGSVLYSAQFSSSGCNSRRAGFHGSAARGGPVAFVKSSRAAGDGERYHRCFRHGAQQRTCRRGRHWATQASRSNAFLAALRFATPRALSSPTFRPAQP